jgi:hypothetical protein
VPARLDPEGFPGHGDRAAAFLQAFSGHEEILIQY